MACKSSGRLLAAGRVLAGMSVRQLAEAAGIDKATLNRLEQSGMIEIAPTEGRRTGMVSGRVWAAIVAALRNADVEIVAEASEHGEGVRRISKSRR